ncbi:ArsR/SmtB family transcription factor [Carnobacterium funditum]|uniref:ArsR/SmtB family transcription factor n=1 Tax=Carnobacterium funditum TaxID=2752 RepID=UPI0005509A15|nr:metalloregulator ArsR/SmtB family transcription factor [Carnobacterium funditum]
MDYESYANVMKALSDPKRVKIVEMLSYKALCACDILEQFDFTQPTLSHHIKVLVAAGLVTVEKTGTWHHYSLNENKINQLILDTIKLTSLNRTVIHEEVEKG